MKVEYIILPFLIQGVYGQLFSVQPQAETVARIGESVTLECVTREEVAFCSWKLQTPGIDANGFITTNVPKELDISARDPESNTDCSIIVDSVMAKHNGSYVCSPYTTSGAQEDGIRAHLIVAQKPVAVEFTGEHAGQTELTAPSDEPVTVTCEARDARPKAELLWYLGDSVLFDGVSAEDEVDPGSWLVTSRSTLTHRFGREDDGQRLRCVANHRGYDEQDQREVALDIRVQYAPYRPEGNDLGTLYGFTAEEEGSVTVNFTSNPAPTVMVWTVGENVQVQAGQQSEDGRFSSGPLQEVDPDQHQYALTLTIQPVRSEDQAVPFQLRLDNGIAESTLSFRVGTGAPPPPPEGNGHPASGEGAARSDAEPKNAALSGGAIAGIIVAVIVLLLLVAIVAFARSRGKWCFAAKPSDAGAEALVNKKKAVDPEMADNKDETKELTGPEAEEPKKEAEVVYAELVLDKDGVKTEVRPSPDKTEYAVIVGTKKEEEKE